MSDSGNTLSHGDSPRQPRKMYVENDTALPDREPEGVLHFDEPYRPSSIPGGPKVPELTPEEIADCKPGNFSQLAESRKREQEFAAKVKEKTAETPPMGFVGPNPGEPGYEAEVLTVELPNGKFKTIPLASMDPYAANEIRRLRRMIAPTDGDPLKGIADALRARKLPTMAAAVDTADGLICRLQHMCRESQQSLESALKDEQNLLATIDLLKTKITTLQKFKDYVHNYLTAVGVPDVFPDGPHTKEGCRIGDRLDWLNRFQVRFKELPCGVTKEKINALKEKKNLLQLENDQLKAALKIAEASLNAKNVAPASLDHEDLEVLSASIQGVFGELNAVVGREALLIAAKLVRKNRDYGASAFMDVVCDDGTIIPALQALQVRMADKKNRKKNLADKKALVDDESPLDTSRDLIGYEILLNLLRFKHENGLARAMEEEMFNPNRYGSFKTVPQK